VLITGIWGETLQIIRREKPEPEPIPCESWGGVWERFLMVRAGKIPDPCPAEVGLRFANLMDMIRQSAASGALARA